MGFIATLLPILLEVLAAAPKVIDEAPAVIKSVKHVWHLATQKEAPTDDERARFDAALEETHKALQDS